jgi:hypothetical protein
VGILSDHGHPDLGGGGSRWPLLALAAVIVAGAGAAVWLLARRPAAPPPQAAPRTTKAPATRPSPTVAPVEREASEAATRPAAKAASRPLLRVDADVPGASVFFDHRFAGAVPAEIRDFAPGSHRVNVSADGYEMYAETIDLDAGTRSLVVRFKEVRLDETIEVVHRHGFGSCHGALRATPEGLRYATGDGKDSFSSPFSGLETLEVDYVKKNLRVRLRGGRTYNFTADGADALPSFHQKVEAARRRLP